MSVRNVTYILGAGASCYSQPLVSDMKERMLNLLHMLNGENQSSDITNFKKKTDHLFKRYKIIVDEMCKHYTPDTYAKKLSLTEQISELNLLKEFLNLYFLFEQDLDKCFYTDSDIKKKYPQNEIWQKIHTPIDYRYDVFLATLLVNKGTKENPLLLLPQNYNIISWNYDNQWEFAYKEYAKDVNLNEINKRFNINLEYDPDKSHIIKVNGYCNCWDDENDHKLTL